MRIKIVLAVFFLCIYHVYAEKIELTDNSIFYGDTLSADIYKGHLFTPKCTVISGYFDKEFSPLVTTYNSDDGAGRLYSNRERKFDIIYIPGKTYEEYSFNSLARYYSFKDKCWVSSNAKYSHHSILKNLLDQDIDSLSFIIHVLYIVMIFGYLVYMIDTLTKERAKSSKWKVALYVFSGVLAIIYFIFADHAGVNYSLLFPLAIAVLILSIRIASKNKSIKKTLEICSAVTFILIASFQYFYLTEKVSIDDKKTIELHWKPGTDVIKRLVIRNLVSNLIKIPNEETYMNKYELREFEYSIIMGNYCSWVIFNKSNSFTTSYYEAQCLISKLRDISGNNNFNLPTDQEWLNAVNEKETNIFREDIDNHSVGSGKPNCYGFYDLEGCECEWTTKEIESWLIQTTYNLELYGTPNCVMAAIGCSGYNTYTLEVCPKVSNYIGMRVAYGENHNILWRIGCIQYQREENDKIPYKGILYAINDKPIDKLLWDDFYEDIISLSDQDRTYTIYSINQNLIRKYKIKIPAFQEPYVFYPITQ